MNKFKKFIKDEKGEFGIGVIIVFVIFLLIIFPILSQIMERNRINIIKIDTTTAVEVSLKSTLVSLNINDASAKIYDFNNTEFINIFKHYLALNMDLNNDLSITDKSIVDGNVKINEIQYHGSSDLPYTSLTGKVYNRPYFNVQLRLIIKPSLFRKLIHNITGIENFYYTYYHDISMPINN